jgi:hypothetical protein
VSCVPCAIRYFYLEDPTPRLLQTVEKLERFCSYQADQAAPLPRRVERLVQAVVTLRERQHHCAATSGPLPDRLGRLMETILGRLERFWGPPAGPAPTPERVKRLQRVILGQGAADAPPSATGRQALDELFIVTQLYCYQGNSFLIGADTERTAALVDQLEEDLLGVPIARPRGPRKAVVAFGEPVPVRTMLGKKDAVATLTRVLERNVQALLAGRLTSPCPPSSAAAALRDKTALAAASPP